MKAYIIQKPDGKFIKKIYTSENYAKKRITNSSRFSNRLNNSVQIRVTSGLVDSTHTVALAFKLN